MAVERAGMYSRIVAAYRAGQSATAWIKSMYEQGLSYTRPTMYADFYSVAAILEAEGALANIRKDYYPTDKTIADVSWKFKGDVEYMFKVKVLVKRGGEITERFVNIMSDIALTPAMMEAEAIEIVERGGTPPLETAERAIAWTAYRTTLK